MISGSLSLYMRNRHRWPLQSLILAGSNRMIRAIASGLLLAIVFLACVADPPVEFVVSGEKAIMTGIINSDILERIADLIADNPQVHTIVMQDVGGSVDDEANLIAARYVRKKGLNTHIPADGMIASGGTDFFLAGVRRSADPGAKIGVHSWDATDGLVGSSLSKDHPDHQSYLAYFREIGIPEEFYWYTLDAAPPDGMHWMTEEEVIQYTITTE